MLDPITVMEYTYACNELTGSYIVTAPDLAGGVI
jgi:hypothetical protein